MRSSASRFWNPKEKFHFEFFEKKSHSIEPRMIDLLHFDGTCWNAYEVKSSLKISDAYIKDACLQFYVLKNSLENFDDLFLVTLNPNYVLEDAIDLKQLFRKRSVKESAEKNIEFFDKAITQMNLVLERNAIPDIPIGKQCFSP